MSALPRPDLPPGPHRDLLDALHDLHHHAGWPSLRTLARETGVSHTTVSKHFSSTTLPTWGTLELLVEALHGDTTHFHELWLAATTPTDGTTNGTPSTPPRIAGRRSELAAVRHHLHSGTGLLLVTGEAGIGKTTLVQAATHDVDTFVASGHCLPLSTEVPLLPIVDVLRAVHDSDGGQWLKEVLTDCPPYVRGALSRLLPELSASTAEVADELSRQHLFAAVTTCLQRLAAGPGLALLVEDLHWGDAASLDLVEYLMTRLEGVPLVGTWRTDDAAVSPTHLAWLDRVRRLSSVVVDLEPLTLEETAEQLRLTSHVDAQRVRRIHSRSGGHPLFTTHLALQPEAEAPLSPLLADLLDRRLQLQGDAARVTTALAVADRGIDARLLGRVTELGDDEVVSALHELASRHLLSRTPGDLARLAHPLLAEAARRRLVPGEGQHLHRRLAEAIGDTPDAEPAEVAEHWRNADDPAHELLWRVRAAERANRRTDPASEASQWLRALEIDENHDVPEFDRTAAMIAAYDALEMSGQLEQCLEIAREALEEVDGLDRQAAAEVLRRAAQAVGLVADDVSTALTLVDRALERLQPLEPSESLVHALDLRANELIDLGRYDEALADLQRALDVCLTLGDDGLYFGTSATFAWHVAHLGDLDTALEQVRRARERLPGSAGPRREAYMAMMHTDLLIQHHRPPEEVAEAARRATAIGREWEMDFHFLTLVGANVVEAFVDAGRVREAAAWLGDVPKSGSYDDWPGLWMAGRVAMVEGRLEESERIMASITKTGSSPQNALHRSVWMALARAWQGRADDAWALLFPSIEAVIDSPATADLWLAFITLARCAGDMASSPSRTGAPVAVDLEQLRRRAKVDPLGPGRSPVTRLAATATWDAELARVHGHDRAEQWTRAAKEWDRLGRPHDAAYCRWRAAQAALRQGQGTLATRLLERAARDAREHVPLSQAIAATTAGLSPQGGPNAVRWR